MLRRVLAAAAAKPSAFSSGRNVTARSVTAVPRLVAQQRNLSSSHSAFAKKELLLSKQTDLKFLQKVNDEMVKLCNDSAAEELEEVSDMQTQFGADMKEDEQEVKKRNFNVTSRADDFETILSKTEEDSTEIEVNFTVPRWELTPDEGQHGNMQEISESEEGTSSSGSDSTTTSSSEESSGSGSDGDVMAEDTELYLYVDFEVRITRGDKQMRFACTASDDGIVTIDEMYMDEDASLSSSSSSSSSESEASGEESAEEYSVDDYAIQSEYQGPPFKSLATDTQEGFYNYLNSKGIDVTMGRYIVDQASIKERQLAHKWWQNIGTFFKKIEKQ